MGPAFRLPGGSESLTTSSGAGEPPHGNLPLLQQLSRLAAGPHPHRLPPQGLEVAGLGTPLPVPPPSLGSDGVPTVVCAR